MYRVSCRNTLHNFNKTKKYVQENERLRVNRYNLTKSVQKLTDQKSELENKLTKLKQQLREIRMEHQQCLLQQQRMFDRKWEIMLETIQASHQEFRSEIEQMQNIQP